MRHACIFASTDRLRFFAEKKFKRSFIHSRVLCSNFTSFRSLSTQMDPKMKRVAVAMSGGVDSCLSAYLLKDQGFQVTGVYMQNWDYMDESGICSNDHDWTKVQRICKQLGIPSCKLNFVKEYWNRIFSNALTAYEIGDTPNPDVFCNKHIKFGAFAEKALGTMGFDYIATGHYAKLYYESPSYPRLCRPNDKHKDQTYFLSAVQGAILPKVLFPMSDMLKSEVKSMVAQLGFKNVAQQRESMGLCFVGKRRRFGEFLNAFISRAPGKFITFEDGRIIDMFLCSGEHSNATRKHDGIHLYTIGQCAKIPGSPEKYYVVKKDISKNILYVVSGKNHPSLFTTNLVVSQFHWIHPQEEFVALKSTRLTAMLRYRESPTPCRINERGKSEYDICFERPVRCVTPGQILVLYDGPYCLGCGVQT